MLYTVLIVIVVLMLLGGLGGPYVNPAWRPGYGAGWYGNGAIMLVLLLLILLFVFGGYGGRLAP